MVIQQEYIDDCERDLKYYNFKIYGNEVFKLIKKGALSSLMFGHMGKPDKQVDSIRCVACLFAFEKWDDLKNPYLDRIRYYSLSYYYAMEAQINVSFEYRSLPNKIDDLFFPDTIKNLSLDEILEVSILLPLTFQHSQIKKDLLTEALKRDKEKTLQNIKENLDIVAAEYLIESNDQLIKNTAVYIKAKIKLLNELESYSKRRKSEPNLDHIGELFSKLSEFEETIKKDEELNQLLVSGLSNTPSQILINYILNPIFNSNSRSELGLQLNGEQIDSKLITNMDLSYEFRVNSIEKFTKYLLSKKAPLTELQQFTNDVLTSKMEENLKIYVGRIFLNQALKEKNYKKIKSMDFSSNYTLKQEANSALAYSFVQRLLTDRSAAKKHNLHLIASLDSEISDLRLRLRNSIPTDKKLPKSLAKC